jgi:hypothetical protein
MALSPAQAALANIKSGALGAINITDIQALDPQNANQLTKDQAESVIKVIMNDETNTDASKKGLNASGTQANVADALINVAKGNEKYGNFTNASESEKAGKEIRDALTKRSRPEIAQIQKLDDTTAKKLSAKEVIEVIKVLLNTVLTQSDSDKSQIIDFLLEKADLPSNKNADSLKKTLNNLSNDLGNVDTAFSNILRIIEDIDPKNGFIFETRKKEKEKTDLRNKSISQRTINTAKSVPLNIGKAILGVGALALSPFPVLYRGATYGGTRDSSKQTKKHKKLKHKNLKGKNLKGKKTKKNKYTNII